MDAIIGQLLLQALSQGQQPQQQPYYQQTPYAITAPPAYNYQPPAQPQFGSYQSDFWRYNAQKDYNQAIRQQHAPSPFVIFGNQRQQRQQNLPSAPCFPFCQ